MTTSSTTRFHVIIKPQGSLCNHLCDYCYYLCKNDVGLSSNRLMSDELLEKLIFQYIHGQTAKHIRFSWQGGEPTLLGLDFFHKILELQKKHHRPGCVIHNDIQTNGILLNDEWCKFLKDNDFLVGISIDGPRELHDCYRIDSQGRGTHDRVVQGIRLLQQYKVRYTTLTVVHRLNAKHPQAVYQFLTRELGSTRMQFQSCALRKDHWTVAPQHWAPATYPAIGSSAARPGTPDSVVTDSSVDPDDFGSFFIGMWDAWFPQDVGHRWISLFETIVVQSMGQPPQICIHHPYCGKNMAAIESDGNVYRCEYYAYPEFCSGNLATSTLGEIALSHDQKDFGFRKQELLTNYCKQCEFLSLCHGECPRTRFIRTPEGEPGLSYFCPGLKKFYRHIQKDLPVIIRAIQQNPGAKPTYFD